MITEDWPRVERRLIEWWPPLRGGGKHNAAAYLEALAEFPVDVVLSALKSLLGTAYAPRPTEIVAAMPRSGRPSGELTPAQARDLEQFEARVAARTQA